MKEAVERPVQFFSEEYLERGMAMSPREIIEFQESFRLLRESERVSDSKLISLRIPTDQLRAFKRKSELHGVKYQTQIKRLMEKWLMS